LEDEIAGILTIQGSYQKQSLVVEYDETITDEALICNAIEKLGYIAE
jgi:copper chaperone CopZ